MSSSVQFSHAVVSDSLRPYGLQHTRPPCPSPNPRVYSNSCPLSQWCHPTISSSVIPFSSCLQPFPASGSFPVSQLFPSGGQSIGVSASTSVPSLTPWEMPPDFFEIRAQRASQVTLVVKKLPANAGERRDKGSVPELGKSPGGGHGSPLQCSYLENPMDRGAWWATVHGVAKSQTWLKQVSRHSHKGASGGLGSPPEKEVLWWCHLALSPLTLMLPYPLPVNGSQYLPPNGHLAHLQPDRLISPFTSLVGLSWDWGKLLCTPCEEQSQCPARNTKPPLWLMWTCTHCLHWTTNSGGPLETICTQWWRLSLRALHVPCFVSFLVFGHTTQLVWS